MREWLADVSVTAAATTPGVTRAHLSRILHGHSGISAELWQGMQNGYDLWQAEQAPRPVIERLIAV